MYNQGHQPRNFYAVSFADEATTPQAAPGKLIPAQNFTFTPRMLALPARPTRLLLPSRQLVALLILLFMVSAAVGSSWYAIQGGGQLASLTSRVTTTPTIVIENPYTRVQTPLKYGVQVAFTEANFFDTTREAFITAQETFIEADLAAMDVRYFEQGVLVFDFPIISKGESGTFFATPAGLYAVKSKKQKHFSNLGQAFLPWSLSFQGNFFIHGTPYYETGDTTKADFTGGIKLSDADAEALFKRVKPGVPVLVYERPSEPDSFLYEPKIPELATPHYLIADVKSNTVLASSDLDAAVPIASLTKLMTAVVATEYINMDTRVATVQPSFVASLIPRLGERSSVSMYSLLQLLLLESSNEAAEVIADEVGRAQFVEYMNERAASLGMDHTKFTDSSGLSAGNVSSVGDLLRLITYIYDKKRFIVDISAGRPLPEMYVSGEFSGLSNFNSVTGLDNFIGGKIGETTAAKQTSVTLHTFTVKGTQRVVAIIILGSDSRTADVQALMTYAQQRFGE